jgi:TRAP-type C4-dicarboxylate transport system substrate-binding protein
LYEYISLNFIDTVEKVSQGRIKVTRYEPGVLVAPLEALDGLGKGMFEASVIFPGYNTGKNPISHVEMGLPYSWQDQESSWLSYNKFGLKELLRKEYAKFNVFWLAGGSVNDVYSIASVEPIRKIADIKGKKIRSWGIMAEYVKMLGGTPVNIPAGELYMALKLGTIDGCLSTDWYLESFKLGEVLKYYLKPNPVNVAGNVSVNMDAWMALDEPLRIALRTALEKAWWSWMAGYGSERRHIANSILPQKYGVQYLTLPPEEVEWIKKESKKLWEPKRKISPIVGEAIKTVEKSLEYLQGDN